MQSIETVYNGHRFRSRLEARWAVFFEAAGIPYLYEPEGYEMSDGTKYLPDFYLPKMHQFFEVKGVMSEKDEHKIEQFMRESGKPIVIGYDDMEFSACDKLGDEIHSRAYKEESVLARCVECGDMFFLGLEGYYGCTCCGAYDGDGHFITELSGYKGYRTSDYYPCTKAVQARFEHGERGEHIRTLQAVRA